MALPQTGTTALPSSTGVRSLSSGCSRLASPRRIRMRCRAPRTFSAWRARREGPAAFKRCAAAVRGGWSGALRFSSTSRPAPPALASRRLHVTGPSTAEAAWAAQPQQHAYAYGSSVMPWIRSWARSYASRSFASSANPRRGEPLAVDVVKGDAAALVAFGRKLIEDGLVPDVPPGSASRVPDRVILWSQTKVVPLDCAYVARLRGSGEAVAAARVVENVLRSFTVNKYYLRRGIGRQLLEHLELQCHLEYAGAKSLKVADPPLELQPFLTRMGYVKDPDFDVEKSLEKHTVIPIPILGYAFARIDLAAPLKELWHLPSASAKVARAESRAKKRAVQ
eukprot:tig00021070_g17816.t1